MDFEAKARELHAQLRRLQIGEEFVEDDPEENDQRALIASALSQAAEEEREACAKRLMIRANELAEHAKTSKVPEIAIAISAPLQSGYQFGPRNSLPAEELHIIGIMFGIRLGSGYSAGIIELFIEDDDIFYLQSAFSKEWLDDLASVISSARHLIEERDLSRDDETAK